MGSLPTEVCGRRLCLPYVDFDLERSLAFAREVHPDVDVLHVSPKTGEGLEAWYDGLERDAARAAEASFA